MTVGRSEQAKTLVVERVLNLRKTVGCVPEKENHLNQELYHFKLVFGDTHTHTKKKKLKTKKTSRFTKKKR